MQGCGSNRFERDQRLLSLRFDPIHAVIRYHTISVLEINIVLSTSDSCFATTVQEKTKQLGVRVFFLVFFQTRV